jgi:hypothetical protein
MQREAYIAFSSRVTRLDEFGAIVYYGQLYENYRIKTNILGNLFPREKVMF